MFHDKTASASRGKWRGILATLGVPDSFLSGKNCPCPMCGGTDRFRFLDRDGSGSWVCNRCVERPGTGLDLVMAFTGLAFPEAASRVDEIVGNVTPDTPTGRREISDDERRAILRALWSEAKPLADDPASRYLAGRGLAVETSEMRFAPAARDGDGGVRPCMVARVLTADGTRVATLHRTFLKPDGSGKAEMASPRKLMPGSLPEGAAVRLGPVKECLGIAEGIETALSASQLFEIPVWSAIDGGNLAKWSPPEGVSEVCIFADNDPGFAGQAAAFALAKRLSGKVEVNVKVPERVGTDWNDVLLAQLKVPA